jgi:hypothetical protein
MAGAHAQTPPATSLGTSPTNASPMISGDATSGIFTINGNVIGLSYQGRIGQEFSEHHIVLGGCGAIKGVDTSLFIESCNADANVATVWQTLPGRASAINYKDFRGNERTAIGYGYLAGTHPTDAFTNSAFIEISNIFGDGIATNFHLVNTMANSKMPGQFVQLSANAAGSTSINVPGGHFTTGGFSYPGTPRFYIDQNALSRTIADGTRTGGEAVGNGAVDLQFQRASSGHVASGDFATIPGGEDNQASGSHAFAAGVGSAARGDSAVAIGRNNVAAGDFSYVTGDHATDGGRYAVACHGAGLSDDHETIQTCRQILSGATSSTARFRLTADRRAPGITNIVNISDLTVYSLDAMLVCKDTSSGDVASWHLMTGHVPGALLRRTAGPKTVAFVGTPSFALVATTAGGALAGMADPRISEDRINGGLDVSVAAGTTPHTSLTCSANVLTLEI